MIATDPSVYENILKVVLAALTGSGGIFAIYKVYAGHKEKMKQMDLEKLKLENDLARSQEHVETLKQNKVPNQYHDVFALCQQLEGFYSTGFKLDDPGRTLVVSEFMRHVLPIYRENLIQVAMIPKECEQQCPVRDKNCNKIANGALMAQQTISSKIYTWHKQKNLFSLCKLDDERKAYDEDSVEAMEVFINAFREKYMKFIDKMAITSINYIAHSASYTDCDVIVRDILTDYLLSIQLIDSVVQDLAMELNGELTGKFIFGVQIEH